jgi:hypothetical protein
LLRLLIAIARSCGCFQTIPLRRRCSATCRLAHSLRLPVSVDFVEKVRVSHFTPHRGCGVRRRRTACWRFPAQRTCRLPCNRFRIGFSHHEQRNPCHRTWAHARLRSLARWPHHSQENISDLTGRWSSRWPASSSFSDNDFTPPTVSAADRRAPPANTLPRRSPATTRVLAGCGLRSPAPALSSAATAL